jgi:hypothetical protein
MILADAPGVADDDGLKFQSQPYSKPYHKNGGLEREREKNGRCIYELIGVRQKR